MGWFTRRKVEQSENSKALEFGRELGEQVAQRINRCMEIRFRPVHERYLEVLRGQLQRALGCVEGPPILVARAAYAGFKDALAELTAKMEEETISALDEEIKLSEEIGVGSEMLEVIRLRLGKFREDLHFGGLGVIADYSVPLKDADTAWRKANPELANKFPDVD